MSDFLSTYPSPETDHSTYVLKTLGEDSFFTLLPIYMDHILEPLLREEAFLSEVFHSCRTDELGREHGSYVVELTFFTVGMGGSFVCASISGLVQLKTNMMF